MPWARGGTGVPRLRLSPLEGQLLRFLEEAGAEDVQTALATFIHPERSWIHQDVADAVAHLARLGLVDAHAHTGEAVSWQLLRDQLPTLPTVGLILTERGQTALVT